MRSAIIFCAGCLLLSTRGYSATLAPANSDDAAMMQLEAILDRSPEQWQGPQHYLYDEDHQAGEETVGSPASKPQGCSEELVRLRRSDGKTVIRRLNRC